MKREGFVKGYFLGILTVAFVIGGLIGIFAYSSPVNWDNNPAQIGHSVDEMDWSKVIEGNVSADGFCIGTSCITSWASGGDDGDWTSFGTTQCPQIGVGTPVCTYRNLYFNEGNVGIGLTNPTAKLEVKGGEVKLWGPGSPSSPRVYVGETSVVVSSDLVVSGQTMIYNGIKLYQRGSICNGNGTITTDRRCAATAACGVGRYYDCMGACSSLAPLATCLNNPIGMLPWCSGGC